MSLPLPRLSTAALCGAAGLGALTLLLSPDGSGRSRAAPARDAMQVMADVILIEAHCRNLLVDNTRAYGFARRNGIEPTDILPSGPRRAAFEAAMRRREAASDEAELCGHLAAERAADIPGVFTAR